MNPKDVIKKEDGLLAYYVSGQLANLLARLALKSKYLTPNLYTTISLLLAIETAILFVFGEYLLGALALLFTLVFDCADGQTARLKGMMSKFGHWYDYHTDKIKDILLASAMAWGVYSQTQWVYVLILPGLIIGAQFLRNITRLNRIIFDYENKIEKKESTLLKPHPSQFITCLKHSTLFKEADRYLLFILGAVTNQVLIMLFVYLGLEMFFATSSAYLNYKKFAKFDILSPNPSPCLAGRQALPERGTSSPSPDVERESEGEEK